MARKHYVEILQCVCKHEFQDKQYGVQKRLYNIVKHSGDKVDKTIKRCTVCGNEILL